MNCQNNKPLSCKIGLHHYNYFQGSYDLRFFDYKLCIKCGIFKKENIAAGGWTTIKNLKPVLRQKHIKGVGQNYILVNKVRRD